METAPVFVKINEYKNVLDIIQVLKGKIKESKTLIDSLQKMKMEEDTELEEWSAELEEIEKRINSMDSGLLRV
jgi:chromosome segregation ATPase